MQATWRRWEFLSVKGDFPSPESLKMAQSSLCEQESLPRRSSASKRARCWRAALSSRTGCQPGCGSSAAGMRCSSPSSSSPLEPSSRGAYLEYSEYSAVSAAAASWGSISIKLNTSSWGSTRLASAKTASTSSIVVRGSSTQSNLSSQAYTQPTWLQHLFMMSSSIMSAILAAFRITSVQSRFSRNFSNWYAPSMKPTCWKTSLRYLILKLLPSFNSQCEL